MAEAMGSYAKRLYRCQTSALGPGIVSNPPYSVKWDGDANPLLINDPLFAPAGVLAPKIKADLAFTMHILSWLAVHGTTAIVEFPGVLYRVGAEQNEHNRCRLLTFREHRVGITQGFE